MRVLDKSKKVPRTAANFWEIGGFWKFLLRAKRTIKMWRTIDVTTVWYTEKENWIESYHNVWSYWRWWKYSLGHTFHRFWLVVGFMWRRILLHTCFQPNITDWTCTAWFPLGENHIWGRTVFPFSFLNKFQKPTESKFLTETWQKSLQLWERNLKCVLRKSCSPRLATLLTRDWGIIQRWRVWWSKSFERKKGVQAWNSVKYFHPCYAEVLLHNMENQCFCRTTLNISRRNPNLLKD